MPNEQRKLPASNERELHFVETAEQVAKNIARLNSYLSRRPRPQDFDMHPSKAQKWYAVSTRSGWQFGPSRYVGYAEMTPSLYLHYREKGPGRKPGMVLNGTETQKALKPLSRPVDPESPLYKKLTLELRRFLGRMRPQLEPNERASISVLRMALDDEAARDYVGTALVREFRRKVRALEGRTEVTRETKQRIGQGLFRKRLLEVWDGKCPLTGITDEQLLRASHIKPWSKCRTATEKLSEDNGLLLSSLWDAAFDSGIVTFMNDGTPKFSPDLSNAARAKLQFRGTLKLTKGHKRNLKWHRKNVFGKSK